MRTTCSADKLAPHDSREAAMVADHGYVKGGPPPAPVGDLQSYPTDAEYARTLGTAEGRAALSTLTADGFPMGSVVHFVLDDVGAPVVCISELAEHTINARRDPKASVLIAETTAPAVDPLAAARLTLIGSLVELSEVPAALRQRYLDLHPSARFYIDYSDFSWWKLVPHAARYVGGFGHMSWVTPEAYAAAAPDPLREAAAGICAHMNDDHAAANLLYAQQLLGVVDATAAKMTAVDRHGFTLAISTPAGQRAGRIAFEAPVDTAEEVRAAVVAMVAEARRRSAAS
jgi:heme iron utilization protein